MLLIFLANKMDALFGVCELVAPNLAKPSFHSDAYREAQWHNVLVKTV